MDAEAAFIAGLELAEAGARLRADLGLMPLPLPERLALNLEVQEGTPGFYWLTQQKGSRATAHYILRKIVPAAAFMRYKYPYARKGRAHLALAYGDRALWIARCAVPGFLAWRRLRRTASDGP